MAFTFGDARCQCGCGEGIHMVAAMAGKKCCDGCTGTFTPPPVTFHENLPAGTILSDEYGTRIRINKMRGTWMSCERIKRDGTRDRRTFGFSGSLPTNQWSVEDALTAPGAK